MAIFTLGELKSCTYPEVCKLKVNSLVIIQSWIGGIAVLNFCKVHEPAVCVEVKSQVKLSLMPHSSTWQIFHF